jgi:hypothetical protein
LKVFKTRIQSPAAIKSIIYSAWNSAGASKRQRSEVRATEIRTSEEYRRLQGVRSRAYHSSLGLGIRETDLRPLISVVPMF